MPENDGVVNFGAAESRGRFDLVRKNFWVKKTFLFTKTSDKSLLIKRK